MGIQPAHHSLYADSLSLFCPFSFSGEYERGSDGKMLHYLSSPDIMSSELLENSWCVESLLDRIAKADPPYHALIDTGALITGMTNLEVASYLLQNGLDTMQGVVFLDNADKKMILVRASMKVMPLEQSGIERAQRFSFYDQVHTTGSDKTQHTLSSKRITCNRDYLAHHRICVRGVCVCFFFLFSMDIKQALNAQAVITLGKDMTFRDYAQGAFRMRGIGVGQTLRVFMIPEVKKTIISQLATAAGASPAERLKIMAADAQTMPQTVTLTDICTWLVINSMKTEKTQFHMLVEVRKTTDTQRHINTYIDLS